MDKVDSYKIWFNKDSMKAAIKYLLDNSFFTVGNCLFRQVIGIPMGSDPAPFFANLFLYFYESKWVKTVMKNDLRRARRFGNTFRFIDDLNALNDGGEFERCYHEIYPPEMELGKENISANAASFLDLNISIIDSKFVVSLYDKRDYFPFSIVRMPYKCSNMPSSIFYASLGAEILRIARATNTREHFIESSRQILCRMRKQGALELKVINTLNKTFGRHPHDFSYIARNAQELINLLS